MSALLALRSSVPKTGHLCKGAAAEQTKHTGNYRGEALGGLLVQLVLRAALQLGTPPPSSQCTSIVIIWVWSIMATLLVDQ